MAERGSVDTCKAVSKQNLDGYTQYVGTLLAPKSFYPVEIYTRDTRVGNFFLFTPNRKRVIGGGYFGGEEDVSGESCERQHMVPGLCRDEDKKTGLGPAIYMAGPVVVKAFGRWRDDCTFSIPGDRTEAAEIAWANLNKHGTAEKAYTIRGIYIETDADSLITDDDAERYLQGYDDEAQGEVTIDSIGGTVTIEGYAESEADVIKYETIADSGLILHLNPEHFDVLERETVPPAALGSADWSQTPMRKVVAIVVQNAQVAAQAESMSREEEASRDYVLETAQEMRKNGWSSVAEALLNATGLGSQQVIPGTQPQLMKMPTAIANPTPKRRQRYQMLKREWMSVYGPNTDWA